ncbi:hypothetical protein INQ51_06850 [Maribellus sp. CM-23]|uniref:hypothetical protein n=1 Tax=Maribellus sp. CM-23 TaxID=2781026 RepID=UPI001F46AF4F|nr:hypothetical protein [Maribellus sp. CM-23]MCE4564025.1 hypothetical protein [Maribellus sp. CM-23]
MKNRFSFQLSGSRHKQPPKLRKWSPGYRLISWLLIVCLLNLSGCMNYFKVRGPSAPLAEEMENLSAQHKRMILHFGEEAWVVTTPKVTADSLTLNTWEKYELVLSKPVVPDKANRYRTKNPYRENAVLNEVHIYASSLNRYPGTLKVGIPVSDIQKIEIYEKDKGATTASWALGILGGTAGALAVLTLLVLLLKSSCPFIYTWDGEQYALTGEIYSGSIQPQLERHDFLKLPVYAPENINYKLKIANEVKEIQHTNLMEMWVFDHASDLNIWVDKYGKYHTAGQLLSPVSATAFDGSDLSALIAQKDSLFFTGRISDQELPLTDGMILEFQKPEKAVAAKVMIRARNSFVLDYMISQFHDQFGDRYKRWNKKQQRVPEAQLRQWSADQNIPLTLSVERNGEWEAVDYYNVIGPMAFKEDILSFGLNGTESNPVKIKLEAGNFFWDIDYVGIDYSADLELDYTVVSATSALDQSGKDITKKILADDHHYYDQPEVGDYAELSFDLPPNREEARSVFLHSKGWYHILRDPKGTPDIEYLKTFREPGRFNRFVNEYMQQMVEYQNKDQFPNP